jgi:dTDP-4-dehydrorhamnose 3,5-epimerase
MHVNDLAIPDIKLVTPEFLRDHRGYFAETYSRNALHDAGIDVDFNRDNISLSVKQGTVRGLHFQAPPHALAKLVRVQRGRIFDVAVDIRHSSPWFGRHVTVELDAETGHQIFVPPGFAHGFCTLETDTVVAYKVSGDYVPAADLGIAWDDPDLAIAWPIDVTAGVLSPRDREQPRLRTIPAYFSFTPEAARAR